MVISPHPLRVHALGVSVDVVVTGDNELAHHVAAVCSAIAGEAADARTECPALVQVSRLDSGRHLVCAPGSGEHVVASAGVLSHVMAAVNSCVLGATPLLAFHCAVVVKGVATVAVTGASGQGKSTLTAALLQRGWEYVSDEALALPWDGGPPLGYPRPISLSRWSRDALGLGLAAGVAGADEEFFSPASLGARVALPQERVTDLVVLDRSEKQMSPRVTAVHRSVVLESLLRRGFTVHADPASAMRQLQTLVSHAGSWRLALGDPQDSAIALERALGA